MYRFDGSGPQRVKIYVGIRFGPSNSDADGHGPRLFSHADDLDAAVAAVNGGGKAPGVGIGMGDPSGIEVRPTRVP